MMGFDPFEVTIIISVKKTYKSAFVFSSGKK